VLTDREEILKLVETSLQTPRAAPGIDRWTYFYGPGATNAINFRVVNFPTAETSSTKEPWAGNFKFSTGLVIPVSLADPDSPNTNGPAKPADRH
jgi:hypothetical protein